MRIKMVLFYIFLFLITMVFYYSWLPSPSFKTESYLPNWLIKWTDENGRLRTAIPFILLGFIIVLLRLKFLNNLKSFIILFVILCTAELGQLFLPLRHFDWGDILVGVLSIILGMILGNWFKKYVMKN